MKPILPFLMAVLSLQPARAAVYAHYSFDTGYADSSGNGRHGTLVDTGTLGNSWITGTAGSYVFGGGAMHFSADRDYVSVPSGTFSSGIPYTISFWAQKTSGDTGQAAEWDMVIGDLSSNFFIALSDVTGPGLRWRSSSSADNRQADFTITKDYNWHHYAIVASGTTISLYMDGDLVGSDPDNLTGFQWTAIGEAYPSSSDFDFNGRIDEMWIFDEALGATAISNLYQYNSTVPEPSCLMISVWGAAIAFRRPRPVRG